MQSVAPEKNRSLSWGSEQLNALRRAGWGGGRGAAGTSTASQIPAEGKKIDPGQ